MYFYRRKSTTLYTYHNLHHPEKPYGNLKLTNKNLNDENRKKKTLINGFRMIQSKLTNDWYITKPNLKITQIIFIFDTDTFFWCMYAFLLKDEDEK